MNKEQVKEVTTEVFARLDAIAAKMGTTIEYLWPAFVRAEIAHGITQLALGVLFFTVGAFAIRKWIQLIIKYVKADFFPGLTFGLLVTIMFFGGFSVHYLGTGMESVVAPEVGALSRLMGTLSR